MVGAHWVERETISWLHHDLLHWGILLFLDFVPQCLTLKLMSSRCWLCFCEAVEDEATASGGVNSSSELQLEANG